MIKFQPNRCTAPLASLLPSLLPSVLLLLAVDVGEARTFTDVKGREISASIVNLTDEWVELRMDGSEKLYKVPLTKLSEADLDYLKSWKKEETQEADNQEEKPAEKKPTRPRKRKKHPHATSVLMEKYSLKENFDDEWPSLISVPINQEIIIAEENETKKRYVYHSPNYEFICDVKLSKNVVNKFAVMFEATREYCRQLPISTIKAHIPGAQFRNQILLFENKSSYIANGGPPKSAGVFMFRGATGVIMVPLTSLGLKKVGSSYMYDYDGSNKVLPHELAHQLTDIEYIHTHGARGWFSEGFAEYCATTPYRSGKFMVRSNLSAIKAYTTAFGKKGRGGRALGTNIDAPDIKKYMLQSYDSFKKKSNFNYGLGLLLTYYFFHMEEDRSNINAFLKALKAGKKGEEALLVLLNGRTFDELEEDISKAWRGRGVRINFM